MIDILRIMVHLSRNSDIVQIQKGESHAPFKKIRRPDQKRSERFW
jgi:hypothetical protein